jgi:hypothetical protein
LSAETRCRKAVILIIAALPHTGGQLVCALFKNLPINKLTFPFELFGLFFGGQFYSFVNARAAVDFAYGVDTLQPKLRIYGLESVNSATVTAKTGAAKILKIKKTATKFFIATPRIFLILFDRFSETVQKFILTLSAAQAAAVFGKFSEHFSAFD